MRRLRLMLLAILAVVVLVRPGQGCSHDGSSAVFTQSFGPDEPYAAFTRGRLGVLGRQYRIRHMVVAYNTLSGRGLTPAEQEAAIAVDRYFDPHGYVRPNEPAVPDDSPHPGAGWTQWQAAAVGYPQSAVNERLIPGQNYETFTNCLDDAFGHAAATLVELRSKYSKPGATDSPEILDWIAGQQAVFSNCAGSGEMPKPAPAGAPLWLRQDRAYQSAAAAFYAMDYDSALAGFRAIAADKASPSAPLARYLVARVLLRKATMQPRPEGTPDQINADSARVLSGLTEARDQLQAILRDPAMEAWHPQARHLLDYVMVRLDPNAQAEELARRLTATAKSNSSSSADYQQNVIDLGYAYRSLPMYAWPLVMSKTAAQIKPVDPLLRWMDDMYGPTDTSYSIGLAGAYQRSRTDVERQQSALENWRTTHGPQWLVAAMTISQPGDDGVAELIEAAKAVPVNSPAYASVTYHRLRLAAAKPATAPNYTEVSALLPDIERTQSRSTINLYLDTQASLAPTLESFLKSAPRLPASYTDEDGYEDSSPLPDYPIDTKVTLCGVSVYGPKAMHFDAAVATIFNQRMPVARLRDASLSTTLPANLRFQLAHMAWTRAVMLDDAQTARALSPYLIGCQPAMKPWLDQYNAAKTPDERHVLGLLAMMRFTSTEPMVRVGGERDFGAYDYMRDNWWCDMGEEDYVMPRPKVPPVKLFSQALVPRSTQPDPPFLTEADRAALDRELAALEKTAGAADYFARQALDWVKAHPNDPHNADVLGFAMRVVRNACRSDATKELSHQLFDTLHRRYPKSEWAVKYTTWE